MKLKRPLTMFGIEHLIMKLEKMVSVDKDEYTKILAFQLNAARATRDRMKKERKRR